MILMYYVDENISFSKYNHHFKMHVHVFKLCTIFNCKKTIENFSVGKNCKISAGHDNLISGWCLLFSTLLLYLKIGKETLR